MENCNALEIVIRVCSKCKERKPATDFYQGRTECKVCGKKYKEATKDKIKQQKKRYYLDNKEHIKERQKVYVENNTEKVKQTKRSYREKNSEKIRAYHHDLRKENADAFNARSREYYQRNKAKKLAQNKRWRDGNKEKMRQLCKDWKIKNKDRLKQAIKQWEIANKESISQKRRERRRRRKQIDPQYKMSCRLRTSLYNALKRGFKYSGALVLLDCSIQDFVAYIESKFISGMSWQNWGNGDGKWNLDHIKPVSSFCLTDPEQQKTCFRWTNFQPLWWKDNMNKSNKLDWIQQGVKS